MMEDTAACARSGGVVCPSLRPLPICAIGCSAVLVARGPRNLTIVLTINYHVMLTRPDFLDVNGVNFQAALGPLGSISHLDMQILGYGQP